MSTETEIVKGLVNLAKSQVPNVSMKCTVSSVDLTALTCHCVPINEDADVLDVQLIAEIVPGVLVIPKVNSIVTVTFINESTAFVSNFGGIDSMELDGDTYGGLVKVIELTSKLNNLENLVNSLIAKYNSHVHVTTATIGLGPAVGVLSPTVTQEATTLTPTVRANIESTFVKHGDGT